MTDREIEAVARAIYGESWVANTGIDAPTWDDVTGTPAGDRFRMMARAAIAALDACRAAEKTP